MRLNTFFAPDGRSRIGAFIDADRKIVDLAAADVLAGQSRPEWYSDMLALIDGGPAALDRARRLADDAAAGNIAGSIVDAASVRLAAPVPVPRQMRDFLCFEEHYRCARENRFRRMAAREADPEAAFRAFQEKGVTAIAKVWYDQPIYYKCNRFAVVGTGADIRWPLYAGVLDYELEFGIFIGKRGINVTRENAASYIFGYTIFNDVSARDAQAKEMEGQLGPAKGKDFDTGNILGPCLVTADEIRDPYNLTMVARINGQEVSRGNSSTMHWSFADLIAWTSRDETLHPGEFFGSGTVGGGCGLENDHWLKPGDVVELEVERIGVLRNRVVGAAQHANNLTAQPERCR